MKLIEPNMEYEQEWINYIREIQENDGAIIPKAMDGDIHNYKQFLKEKEQNKTSPFDKNLVPSILYFMVDGSRIIGVADLRLCLNDFLLQYGGHIGYSIRPSERGNGYGNMILKLVLEKCKEMELSPVLVTCKKTNQASAKVIMKNGGILENELVWNEETQQRYWIQIK